MLADSADAVPTAEDADDCPGSDVVAADEAVAAWVAVDAAAVSTAHRDSVLVVGSVVRHCRHQEACHHRDSRHLADVLRRQGSEDGPVVRLPARDESAVLFEGPVTMQEKPHPAPR